MNNFRKAKENMTKGIGNHSTLITFIFAAFGVGATVFFASREIPKAEKEVKEIISKEDLTKKQKVVESAKSIGKNCWKTAVIALGTVLIVTGTSAIATANAAATVAGMTNTIGILDQKIKDYETAINESSNKKVKEEIKNAVNQKIVNRATEDLKDEIAAVDERCPDRYLWLDAWTGVKFKATYNQVETAAKITELLIGNEGYQKVFDFYEELIHQGAEFIDESYPQMVDDFAWTHAMDCELNVYHNDKGYTVHTINYNEPTMNW